MRKLVFILIGFIAVVTFIRAYDNSHDVSADYSESVLMAGSDN